MKHSRLFTGMVLVIAASMTATSFAESKNAGQPPKSGKNSMSPEAAPGEGHDLTIEVTDVNGVEGNLVMMLFTKPDGFPDNFKKAAMTAKVSPKEPTYTFANLRAGNYVVVVFHDRNKDGKVEKSIIGFPTEPIGLSHHPSIGPKGGPPNFEKAKVSVAKATEITINMIDLSRAKPANRK